MDWTAIDWGLVRRYLDEVPAWGWALAGLAAGRAWAALQGAVLRWRLVRAGREVKRLREQAWAVEEGKHHTEAARRRRREGHEFYLAAFRRLVVLGGGDYVERADHEGTDWNEENFDDATVAKVCGYLGLPLPGWAHEGGLCGTSMGRLLQR